MINFRNETLQKVAFMRCNSCSFYKYTIYVHFFKSGFFKSYKKYSNYTWIFRKDRYEEFRNFIKPNRL